MKAGEKNIKVLTGFLVLFALLGFCNSAMADKLEKNLSSDPKVEIITEAIKKLSGSSRGRLAAVKELRNAGEYAIPYMLDAMADDTRRDELTNIIWALPQIGRDATRPLVAALQTENVVVKAEIIKALGKIGYPQSMAYLKYVIEKDDSAELCNVATQSIKKIDPGALKLPAAQLFYSLAESYFDHSGTLTPTEDAVNMWFWDSTNHRLVRQKVDKSCFNELMAIQACEWTLKADPSHIKVISLLKTIYLKIESTDVDMSSYFGPDYVDAMAVLSLALQDEDEQTRDLAVETIANMAMQSNQIIPLLKIDNLQASPKPFTEMYKSEIRKRYVTRSETIPTDCIELQEGPYGVPFDATPSEVIEWSKKQGLVLTKHAMEEESIRSRISSNLHEIEQLREEGFSGWDPNEGSRALVMKLSTEEVRFALEYRCVNLALRITRDGHMEQGRVWSIRDDLNTLNNPYYVNEKGKYPFVPVFRLGRGYPKVVLFHEGDRAYTGDGRIIRNTCELVLSMPHAMPDQLDPLDIMVVFFVRTAGGQWKSYAVLSIFVPSTKTHEKIVNTLNEKYGHYRWVKPNEFVRKDNVTSIKPSEATKLRSKLKHLAGFDVEEDLSLDETPDFLVWQTNLFAYGGYSELTLDYTDYRNFSLSRSSDLSLFYYDAKYGEEIIQMHITAAKAAIKEYYKQQEHRDKQLKEKF